MIQQKVYDGYSDVYDVYGDVIDSKATIDSGAVNQSVYVCYSNMRRGATKNTEEKLKKIII